jgi:hypothetical protein
MTDNVREMGYLGEQEFIKLLNKEGIPFSYLDDWVDFEIYNTFIDVKSCLLSHKFTDKRSKTQSYKVGRFDFTDEQREKTVWIAFFVRNREDFLFLGIGKLPKNCSRYMSIHKTRELNLLSLKDWIKKIKR